MKWLRCNKCYTRARDAKQPFALTKCGHIYCSRCAIQAEKQCVICSSVNVPTMQLQEPLDPNYSLYFKPMSDSLSQLLEVCNFQEEQLRITMKRFDEMDLKYRFSKEVHRNMEIGMAKMSKKNRHDKEEYGKIIQALKNENKQLRLKLKTIEQSQHSSFVNYRNNRSSASHSTHQHNCQHRFQQPDLRGLFSTPGSANTNRNTNSNSNSFVSSNSDRTYLASLAGSDRTFRIPNSSRVPRSTVTRSAESTVYTPSRQIPQQLESLLISKH